MWGLLGGPGGPGLHGQSAVGPALHFPHTPDARAEREAQAPSRAAVLVLGPSRLLSCLPQGLPVPWGQHLGDQKAQFK